MIIAIDFDGTICRSDFPVITGAMPYAKEAINQLHKDGHYIIIWTCRTGKNLLDAINWLLQEGIAFDRVNDHNPDNAAQYGHDGKKVYADLYIDDKNLGGFIGWKEALQQIGSPFDGCWP
ncbi:MAG TPA: HAD hydrolase family protein [Paludibacteraceae bacterium]|nr:HAD hydrolase family protein [Paludibacteraceae bacterium]